MDSLLANYASSDDEEEEEKESKPSSYPSSLSKPSFLSSLPPPKFPNPPSSSSSSSSSSLMPPPRSRQIEEIQPVESKQTRPLFSSLPPPSSSSSSSSLFPSMPPPKSQHVEESQTFDAKRKRHNFSSVPPPKSQPAPNPNPRKPVQFSIPLNPSLLKPSDSDDEDDEEVKDSSDSPVVAPAPAGHIALTSILPTAKNFLAVAPTASSRRSAFDSSLHAPSKAETLGTRQESSSLDVYGSSKAESFEGGEQQHQHQQQESGNSEDYGSYPLEQEASGYENYVSYDGSWAGNGSADASYASSYQSGGYENFGSYVGNTSDGNAAAVALPVVPEMERIAGKRGRNAIPTEIVEVTQADLMKNRPREDQVKATGIAFGPAYQAVSSSKGKPSKLHKRKHQIGSLFFDMKQKEMELAERRSKGLLTKAETHAKYGW